MSDEWDFGDGVTWSIDDFTGADVNGRGGHAFVENWVRHWQSAAGAFRYARGLAATSSSSVTPGTGSKPFAIDQATASFPTGAVVQAKSRGSPDHWIIGDVDDLVAGTLTIIGRFYSGSDPKTDWIIGNVVAVGDPPRGTLITGDVTAAHGTLYRPDTTLGAITITCPGGAAPGERFHVADAFDTFATNALIIDGDGVDIIAAGLTGDRLVCDQGGEAFWLEFNGTSWGVVDG